MPNNVRNQPMYFQSGDPETENLAVLPYPGQLGSRVTITEPLRGSPTTAGQFRPKTYQLVQSDSSMAVAPFSGAVAWWSDKTKYLVTTDSTKLGRGRIAGVFRNTLTVGNYGYVQVQGPCPNVKFIDGVVVANVTAVGNYVIPSATAGKADVIAAGTATTYPPLGVTAGLLSGGDSTAPVDLDVPETP